MVKKDYYAILNIDYKATQKQIKSAYRQMALKYHPDHNPDNPEAAKNFNLIREAYEVLTDSELKKNYDSQYSPRPTGPTREAEPRPQTTTTPKSAKNLRYNLYISLEDVASGCERTIRYIRKNKGEAETIQLKVKVPKGAFHHQRLRLAQYGDTDGRIHGDLFVIVHLQNHPIFILDGLNLRVNIPISYLDALLGNTIEIPTLTGTRKQKLKACQFDDLDYTFKGYGLPQKDLNYKGDLHVHCFIENPSKLSTAERTAIEKALKTWPKGEMMQQYQSYIQQHKRR